MYLQVHICLLLIALGTVAVQGKVRPRLQPQGGQLRPDSEPWRRFDGPCEF